MRTQKKKHHCHALRGQCRNKAVEIVDRRLYCKKHAAQERASYKAIRPAVRGVLREYGPYPHNPMQECIVFYADPRDPGKLLKKVAVRPGDDWSEANRDGGHYIRDVRFWIPVDELQFFPEEYEPPRMATR